jgi:hypothetical protein
VLDLQWPVDIEVNGTDQAYWDRCLDIYRFSGKAAVMLPQ